MLMLFSCFSNRIFSIVFLLSLLISFTYAFVSNKKLVISKSRLNSFANSRISIDEIPVEVENSMADNLPILIDLGGALPQAHEVDSSIAHHVSESKKSLYSCHNSFKVRWNHTSTLGIIDIAQYIQSYVKSLDRTVVILAENYGASLALYLALRNPDQIEKLILFNPIKPSLLIDISRYAGSDRSSRHDEIFRVGYEVLKNKYDGIKTPTLILFSPESPFPYSFKENADTFKIQMKNTLVELLSLSPPSVDREKSTSTILNLSAAASVFPPTSFPTNPTATVNKISSKIDGQKKVYDAESNLKRSKVLYPNEARASSRPPITDYYPSPETLNEVEPFLNTMRRLFSPVFLQRDSTGALSRGLSRVPVGSEGRPVLFVGNHQLYGLDMSMLIGEFLKERNVMMRGLAHPVIFEEGDSSIVPLAMGGGMPGVRATLEKYGAVEVTPSSLFQLLQLNATALLFPGGAREAYHMLGEDYQLFWSEKVDFVRMAGAFRAIIVPFAAIGMADTFDMVLDGNALGALPLVGERLRRVNELAPKPFSSLEANLITPLAVPKWPARNYFLFQQPIDTASISIYDKTASRAMYEEVRASVEDGIAELLRFREADPYSQFPARVAYETITGRQAPSAPLNIRTN